MSVATEERLAVVRHGRLRHLVEVALPPGIDAAPGGEVVLRTDRGHEVGWVLAVRSGEAPPGDLARAELVRALTAEDEARVRAQRAQADVERRALAEVATGLGLRLVAAERLLDGGTPGLDKLVLYYAADARVDVPTALTRAEAALGVVVDLVQVGARQRARACGGAGPCGRGLCCSTFLRVMEPVPMRMAKVQGVSHAPEATAGACGRLKCCLRYENPAYDAAWKSLPRVGFLVRARRATGIVLAVDVLRRRVLVRPNDAPPEGGRTTSLHMDEVEHSGPAPRAPLPRAGEATPSATPPERGWSELARRFLRRMGSGRVPRQQPPPPPPPES